MVDILALVLQHDEQAVLTAVELALSDGVATKTHVLNILHRLIDGRVTDSPTIDTPQALLLRREPKANVERYDDLRLVSVDPPHAFHECSSMLSARVWEHRRSLTDLGAGRTLVTDELRMVPRVPLPAPARALVAQALRALFAHRHRRLQAALATAGRPLD